MIAKSLAYFRFFYHKRGDEIGSGSKLVSLVVKIVEQEREVVARLSELGLKLSMLHEVLKHISGQMASYTDDHPSWGPGITTASEAVFALRSVTRAEKWYREEEKGFALAVHPSGKIAVNIAKGDNGTGDGRADLSTVSSKGPCTTNAISQNQMTFDFSKVDDVPPQRRQTWYLVYCSKADGLHAEISLPSGQSNTDQISIWRERIILPVVREDRIGGLAAGFDDGGFKVNLTRKVR